MNHKFLPNQLDKQHCSYHFENGIQCKRDLMSHTKLARCESCNETAECDIYTDDILLCWTCKDNLLQELLDNTEAASIKTKELNMTAREIEKIGMDGLTFSGDLYNLRLQTFAEMAQAIKNDATISDGADGRGKEYAFQSMVAERISQINLKVNVIDEDKRQLLVERLAAANSLREFGGKIRDEIRNKLKESDASYQPIINAEALKKQIKKNVVKSPFERAAEALAIASNMTLDAARDIILKGIKK